MSAKWYGVSRKIRVFGIVIVIESFVFDIGEVRKQAFKQESGFDDA
jgi:hypothetical protein